jgi:uncharacterized protein
MDSTTRCTAFEGTTKVAAGDLGAVALVVKVLTETAPERLIIIYDDASGQEIDIDFRGSDEDVLSRITSAPPQRGRGRPKLGVVAKEITLLPRHWEWLASQSGGASATIRRLIDEARRANTDKDRQRQAQKACYRFMSAVAGNLPDFEEASRALFAGNLGRLSELSLSWPADVRQHVLKLAVGGMSEAAPKTP